MLDNNFLLINYLIILKDTKTTAKIDRSLNSKYVLGFVTWFAFRVGIVPTTLSSMSKNL